MSEQRTLRIPHGAHQLGAFRSSDDRTTGKSYESVMERNGPGRVRCNYSLPKRSGVGS